MWTLMATQNEVGGLYLPPYRGWRQIAEEASKEQDFAKLMNLTDELVDALANDFD